MHDNARHRYQIPLLSDSRSDLPKCMQQCLDILLSDPMAWPASLRPAQQARYVHSHSHLTLGRYPTNFVPFLPQLGEVHLLQCQCQLQTPKCFTSRLIDVFGLGPQDSLQDTHGSSGGSSGKGAYIATCSPRKVCTNYTLGTVAVRFMEADTLVRSNSTNQQVLISTSNLNSQPARSWTICIHSQHPQQQRHPQPLWATILDIKGF